MTKLPRSQITNHLPDPYQGPFNVGRTSRPALNPRAFNAPKELHVKAFAPARILHNGDFKNAQNYLTSFDPVPLLDPIRIVRGIKNGNLHYMPSTGCPILDHLYNNSEFEKNKYMMV